MTSWATTVRGGFRPTHWPPQYPGAGGQMRPQRNAYPVSGILLIAVVLIGYRLRLEAQLDGHHACHNACCALSLLRRLQTNVGACGWRCIGGVETSGSRVWGDWTGGGVDPPSMKVVMRKSSTCHSCSGSTALRLSRGTRASSKGGAPLSESWQSHKSSSREVCIT